MGRQRCPSCGFTYRVEVSDAGASKCGHCGWTWLGMADGTSDGTGHTEGDMATNIPWDVVALRLRAEMQVETETVRVFVSGNLLASGDDTGSTHAMLSAALSKVIDGQWLLSTARRGEDPSGMERVSVAASLRVKEHLTAGLVERLKQASRAGLQLHLDHILTRPPQAEMDKAIADLRQQLYQRARDEAELLNRLIPADEGKWRVGSMEFSEIEAEHASRGSHASRGPQAQYREVSSGAPAGSDDPDPDLPVSTRTILEAKVQFKRLSVAAPERGSSARGEA
jgi:hypothetical protein